MSTSASILVLVEIGLGIEVRSLVIRLQLHGVLELTRLLPLNWLVLSHLWLESSLCIVSRRNERLHHILISHLRYRILWDKRRCSGFELLGSSNLHLTFECRFKWIWVLFLNFLWLLRANPCLSCRLLGYRKIWLCRWSWCLCSRSLIYRRRLGLRLCRCFSRLLRLRRGCTLLFGWNKPEFIFLRCE